MEIVDFLFYMELPKVYILSEKRNNKGNERIGENILYKDFKFLDGKIWI